MTLQPFQLLIKPVSARCNANCTYCFYKKVPQIFNDKPLDPMPLDLLELMIKKYLNLGFKENFFFWQGGEPTLAGLHFYEKAIEFMKIYGRNRVIGNAFQTNGLLIDENWAKFFYKYKMLVGISLDGPKELHDPFRGKGTHQKVLRAINILHKHNVEFNILIVLHKKNTDTPDKIEKIYDFLKTLPCNFFQFIPALDNDPFTGKATNYSITPQQYGNALIKIFNLWKKDDFKKISIRLFDSIINYLAGYPRSFCILEPKCSSYLVIENQGDVYPCDFFVRPKYKLGNIQENSFKELMIRRQKSFTKLKMKISKECNLCKWRRLCNGGCPKDKLFSYNNDPKKTYFCNAYKRFFNETYSVFKQIYSNMSSFRNI
ncbi:MAG: anaerobic sulfatase maturase [Promethearchaeota archaeon]